MNFNFASQRPADADAIIFPVTKNGLDDFEPKLEQAAMVKAGAKAARFEGKLGEVFETFVTDAGKTLRVVLTGLGKGKASHSQNSGFRLQACRYRSLRPR